MEIIVAYWLDTFRRILDFQGLSPRYQFNSWLLFGLLTNLFTGFLRVAAGHGTAGAVLTVLLLPVSILLLLCNVSLIMRRLRDSGVSPLHILWALAPFAGILGLLIYCAVVPTSEENKRYYS